MTRGPRSEETLSVKVRAAVPEDAPELAAILADVGWFSEVMTDETEPVARIAEQVPMAREAGYRVMLGAEFNGDVVGYAQLHRVPMLFLAGPEAYLTEQFVAGWARGCGVGGRLLDEAVRVAGSWGASRVSLLSHRGRESYQRGFYPARGFDEATPLAVMRRSLA